MSRRAVFVLIATALVAMLATNLTTYNRAEGAGSWQIHTDRPQCDGGSAADPAGGSRARRRRRAAARERGRPRGFGGARRVGTRGGSCGLPQRRGGGEGHGQHRPTAPASRRSVGDGHSRLAGRPHQRHLNAGVHQRRHHHWDVDRTRGRVSASHVVGRVYDAGTEENAETAGTVPCLGGEGVSSGDAADGEGTITHHAGIGGEPT